MNVVASWGGLAKGQREERVRKGARRGFDSVVHKNIRIKAGEACILLDENWVEVSLTKDDLRQLILEIEDLEEALLPEKPLCLVEE